jgi:hypothetical protein
MLVHVCQSCGKEILSGGLFYKVRLVSQAGFDGVLNEDDSNIEGAIARIDEKDQEMMERDVYFEMEAILCIGCKERIIESFQREVGLEDSIGPGERLH